MTELEKMFDDFKKLHPRGMAEIGEAIKGDKDLQQVISERVRQPLTIEKMTDEEIIQKAFKDNSSKYDDWKDCCVAMMRDAMEMKKEQMSEELKFDVDKLTLGDVKFAMEHSPYYAEMVLRAMADDVIKMCRNVVIKNN